MELKKPLLSQRMSAIEIVRGLAMMFMALDHAREFFSFAFYEPTDLSAASAVLFLTRWIKYGHRILMTGPKIF